MTGMRITPTMPVEAYYQVCYTNAHEQHIKGAPVKAHLLDIVPGMFCAFGLILICLSIAMQFSLVSLGGAWLDFAKGFSCMAGLTAGFAGMMAASIWLFGT
jgi:hypothetical protein